MPRDYHQMEDGEWITIRKRGFREQCCDCGLVHIVDYRVANGALQVRATRDARATNGARRARKHAKRKRNG